MLDLRMVMASGRAGEGSEPSSACFRMWAGRGGWGGAVSLLMRTLCILQACEWTLETSPELCAVG